MSDPVHAPGGKIPIEFLGVWDTVDAVGMPFRITDLINASVYRFKFPDTTLNNQVKKACHALALDEDPTTITLAQTATDGTPVFNFVLARIRYRDTIPANNVRCFFNVNTTSGKNLSTTSFSASLAGS